MKTLCRSLVDMIVFAIAPLKIQKYNHHNYIYIGVQFGYVSTYSNSNGRKRVKIVKNVSKIDIFTQLCHA